MALTLMERTLSTRPSVCSQGRPQHVCIYIRGLKILPDVFTFPKPPLHDSATISLTLERFLTLLKAARHDLYGEDLKRQLEAQSRVLSNILYKVRHGTSLSKIRVKRVPIEYGMLSV